ncbi:MAG: type II secretion system F family protein [Candidatus Omnitrophica bacterium]|nr:type II secretion system F family protein [Candidatus Omnitrophota bacterium]MCA9415175.1 type II secretion system F family protein [Candidatus Omnitrophota bacterium]MCA9425163.1 type II secretion system F family protein [Candidatus Omnitrophota bacterium]MCA9428925.1 type II secretion system F family protein [Candidatus Omnitrophota bacterium]MCA9442737.1 type II secretion system F family protein [Candidatus Omnitrophota bacterium]
MPAFSYRAMDRAGKEIKGQIEASTEEVVIDRLRGMGYFPTEVKKAKDNLGEVSLEELPGIKQFMKVLTRGKVPLKSLMPFTRQLAVLVGAGLPLLRSLRILSEQTESANLKEALIGISEEIESGNTLSEGMAKYPRVFDRLFVNMIRAGEIGGALEQVLERLAIFAEKSAAIRSKVKSAMFYPVFAGLIAGSLLIGIMGWVVPNFVGVYEELGAELPGMTQLLIDISDTITQRYWAVIMIFAFFIIIWKTMRRYDWGLYATDSFKLRLPIFGKILQKAAIAKWARTFATLLEAGVPILQTLSIVKDTSGNEVVARAVLEVHNSIKEGETISDPLKKYAIFPPLVTHMVAVGEETGSIDTMLVKVAEFYEREVDDAVDGLSKLIEPLLIVVLGGIIGFIVIALYLPVFNLVNEI